MCIRDSHCPVRVALRWYPASSRPRSNLPDSNWPRPTGDPDLESRAHHRALRAGTSLSGCRVFPPGNPRTVRTHYAGVGAAGRAGCLLDRYRRNRRSAGPAYPVADIALRSGCRPFSIRLVRVARQHQPHADRPRIAGRWVGPCLPHTETGVSAGADLGATVGGGAGRPAISRKTCAREADAINAKRAAHSQASRPRSPAGAHARPNSVLIQLICLETAPVILNIEICSLPITEPSLSSGLI